MGSKALLVLGVVLVASLLLIPSEVATARELVANTGLSLSLTV